MKARTELIQFPIHGDERGSLVALECEQDIPFKVRRVYYIYGTQPGVPRGFHAHRKLKQILIAVSGSVTIDCEYLTKKEKFILDSPEQALLIEGLVWHEMHNFSENCVLLVLASEHYCEEDYIRNYDDFKKEENV